MHGIDFDYFSGSIPTEKLTHEAYWVLNTINTRAAITPDACEQSSCPLAADDGFLLTNQLFVNSTLPSVRLLFRILEKQKKFNTILIYYIASWYSILATS